LSEPGKSLIVLMDTRLLQKSMSFVNDGIITFSNKLS
jgi:hypothetical protein